jgi:hypothetical protein
MMVPGAWPNVAKRQVVLAAAMAACDGLDGVVDNLVSHPRACQQVFNPATAQYNGKPVRCAAGADLGDSCLSDAQIGLLKYMYTPFVPGYSLTSGDKRFPGFAVWGMDLGASTSDIPASAITTPGLGTIAPAFPAVANMPFLHIYGDQYIKYFSNPRRQCHPHDRGRGGAWHVAIAAVATHGFA